MMKAITIRLESALASCGEYAVGDTRTTLIHLTQSQVLGMVASACGIHRNADDLVSFFNAWQVITYTEISPQLRDFQTAKNTLKLNNDRNKFNQISTKYYLTGFKACAVLIPKPEIVPQLNEVLERLRKPANPLYIGRKSCPLSSFLQPEIIEVDNICILISKLKEMQTNKGTLVIPTVLMNDINIDGSEKISLSDKRLHKERLFMTQEYRIIEV